MEKKIVLSLACLLIGIGLAIAQTPKTVTGLVIFEEDNQPIVGASVLIKGTNQGAVTDLDGKFTLTNVPGTAKILRITYVGMQTIEVNIKSGTMKIVMKPDAEVLEEVVVTGMTKMDKRLFTGAATKLSSEDVKLDGLADISRSLEGRAAGVSVQNVSGTFGTAPKIRVRGATSIYGSSKPLWVVDGIIMEDVTEVSADELSSGDAVTLISSAIAGLNANDIESFQILKDGSATSIYGARAMAGVIVVTTKKGQAGKSHISYTGEFTMRMTPRYADFNIMNSQEQMGVYKEMKEKGWLNFSDTYRAAQSGVYGKMYQLMNTYNPVTGTFALEHTDTAMNDYLQEAEYRNTDWFDALFSNSVMHNHSVSLSSGTEKASFYASLSAMADPGWYKDSEVNRYTANLNATYNISKQLSINLISSAAYRKQKAPGTLSQSVDPVYGEVKRDFDINPYSYALNTSRALDSKTMYTRNYADFNILHELDNNYMNLDVADLKFQGELKWKPITGLEFSALGAVKYSATSQEHLITDDSNQAMAYRAMPDATVRDRNPFLYTDPDNPYALPISVLPQGGIYQRTNSNATYSYQGKYTVNGTYRYEGTNRLGKSRSARWLPTWNISAAWNMHEEEFFESLKPALAHFALKASYSLTGDPGPNTVTNSTMVLKSYKPYRPFANIQESGLKIIDLANDDLTYEKKHELNIGADMGFLDNRINFAIDWYKRDNYDLIGVIQTPGVGGQIRKLANVATMKSHGVEFTLSTRNIQTKDFGWTTDFIFSQAKNEVTDLESDAEVIDVVSGTGFALKGYPVRGLFSYQFKGLNEDGLPTFIDQDGNLTSDGNDIDFQSQKLDYLKYEGPTDPTITGSFGNIFRYKGFKLNVFITYSFGNVIRLDPVFSNEYTDLTSMPKEFKNRWVLAGEESITTIPTIVTKRQSDTDNHLKTLYNAYNYSTERIAKGDFIRMKEISVSYDFPKKWLEKIFINDLSLKLQATNLFLIYSDDKLNGQDPEFFRSGGVAAPVPKQFTLTLRLGI